MGIYVFGIPRTSIANFEKCFFIRLETSSYAGLYVFIAWRLEPNDVSF